MKLQDYLFLYLNSGIMCLRSGEGNNEYELTGISLEKLRKIWWVYFDDREDSYGMMEDVFPILRPLSDITDEELLHCGKLICAIPNHKSGEFEALPKRTSNTVGVHYTSKHFTSLNYFSIWNETDSKVGHIEMGWFEGDKRKKELWRVGGYHEATKYLLERGFDIYGLIKAKLAVDKTKQPIHEEN